MTDKLCEKCGLPLVNGKCLKDDFEERKTIFYPISVDEIKIINRSEKILNIKEKYTFVLFTDGTKIKIIREVKYLGLKDLITIRVVEKGTSYEDVVLNPLDNINVDVLYFKGNVRLLYVGSLVEDDTFKNEKFDNIVSEAVYAKYLKDKKYEEFKDIILQWKDSGFNLKCTATFKNSVQHISIIKKDWQPLYTKSAFVLFGNNSPILDIGSPEDWNIFILDSYVEITIEDIKIRLSPE